MTDGRDFDPDRRLDPGGDIIQLQPSGRDARRVERLPELVVHTFASLAANPAPPRPWIVDGIIPDRTVTLLSGDGGVGKSLLALQLGSAMTNRSSWIGCPTTPGKVLYIGAEDDTEEVNRRLEEIAKATGIQPNQQLHIVSLATEDAILCNFNHVGSIALTPLWHAIEKQVAAIRPKLLILDNAADVFGGNEISRSQVRQFIAALRSVAIRYNAAVLLLSHPSVSGMASGSGTSGSTAWNNSARSRLYFDYGKATAGEKQDRDSRLLKVMKSNYGRRGVELDLDWRNGVFEPASEKRAPKSKAAPTVDAERIFMELLATFQSQKRDVSPNPSSNFAPTVFAKHPDAQGVTGKGFGTAMDQLLKRGAIQVEKYGPPSKQRCRLLPTPK